MEISKRDPEETCKWVRVKSGGGMTRTGWRGVDLAPEWAELTGEESERRAHTDEETIISVGGTSTRGTDIP